MIDLYMYWVSAKTQITKLKYPNLSLVFTLIAPV